MILIFPLAWLVVWLIAAVVIGTFSGLAPQGSGLTLFLAIFLGGGFVLPLVVGAGWLLWRRLHGK
ncbi:MAG: hypothetical protein ACRES7_10700 [Gammaproteobacteria bacterium]